MPCPFIAYNDELFPEILSGNFLLGMQARLVLGEQRWNTIEQRTSSTSNNMLGHKRIENTLKYVQLAEELFKDEIEYSSKVVKTEKEICGLVEAGFEYVTEFEGAKIFKKRKL